MSDSMEIPVEINNLDRAMEGLDGIADRMERIAGLEKSIAANVPEVPSVPDAPSSPTRYFSGPNQKLAAIEEQLAKAREENAEAAIKDLERMETATRRLLEPVEAVEKSFRYMAGPTQKLAAIEEQLIRAREEGNEAAINDLQIARARALRAKAAGEKLVEAGEDGTHAPGLLDLVNRSNSLLQSLAAGNILGAVRELGAGIKLFTEKPGGLNAAQRQEHTKGIADFVAKAPAAPVSTNLADFDLSSLSKALPASPIGKAPFDLSFLKDMESGAAGAAEAATATEAALGGTAAAGAGLAAVLGPLAIVGLAVVGAFKVVEWEIKTFAGILKHAADELQAIRRAETLSGGRASDVAGLGVFGIKPDQVAQAAAAFRQRISVDGGDPLAMSRAANMGIRLPGIRGMDGGSANEAALLEQGLEGLRKQYTALIPKVGEYQAWEETLNQARIYGIEGIVDQVRASEAVYQARKRDAAAMDSIASRTKDGEEFYQQLQRVGDMWNLLVTAAGAEYLGDWSKGLGAIADSLREAAVWVGENGPLVRGLIAIVAPAIGATDAIVTFIGQVGSIPAALGEVLDKTADALRLFNPLLAAGLDAAADALKKIKADTHRAEKDRDQELRRNTEEMRRLREGFTGGGAQARGAIPDGWRGSVAEQVALGRFRGYGAVGLL